MELAIVLLPTSAYSCHRNFSSRIKHPPLVTQFKYSHVFSRPFSDFWTSSLQKTARVRGCRCYIASTSGEKEEEEGGGREILSCGIEQPGGKMVAQLVGVFNQLTDRNRNSLLLTSSSSLVLLFNTLKLALPILQSLPPKPRSPLSQSLSVALILADLQMDAEVISAAILRPVVESGSMSLTQVRDRLGTSIAHLLHESLRLNNIFSSRLLHLPDVDHDRDYAATLKKFCLTYYDFRALIMYLALKLDTMRHLQFRPRHQQLVIALEVLKLHAPLAHALDDYSTSRFLSLELEDLSFRYLFPNSYLYLDAWLRSQEGTETGSKPLIDDCREQLHQSLLSDPFLTEMVDEISVKGRYKSRYSTMKKLLGDGRKPEQVNDIFGLRVILSPSSRLDSCQQVAEKACYRARDVARSLWKEIPSRTKDYIARPKANGYKSLHIAVDVGNSGGRSRPLMEIQIRTVEMDRVAAEGTASHSLYKSGLTDPDEAKHIKAIMIAAAEVAALRLQQDASSKENEIFGVDGRNQVFSLLDKNNDGKISIEELMEVMEELGAEGEDAREMMLLLDSNSDGSLSADEFDTFQKQVELLRNLDSQDDQYKTLLDHKLQVSDNTARNIFIL